MTPSKYSLATDNFDTEDIQAAIDVLQSGHYTMGQQVQAFEKALADWLGVKQTIMVNSGSSANLLLVDSLLRRLNSSKAPLKSGDEVLVPALAWPTTVWPLIQLGLKPVFVDIDQKSLSLSLDSATEVLSPKVRGLFLIHVLGYACDMSPYVDFCRKHDLVLFEDCCESFGAFEQGQHVGTFGYGGSLSHFFSHHLTTIEGGSLITNDDELADDFRSLRAHGWIRERKDKKKFEGQYPGIDSRFLFVLPGYNVRPIEIQAAIGLVQLKKMDSFLENRNKIANHVIQLTQQFAPWMEVPGKEYAFTNPTERKKRKHSWMCIPFILNMTAPVSVDVVKTILEENGVETRAIIAGNLTRHPAIKLVDHRTSRSLQNADELLERGFMIGCSPSLEGSLTTLEKAFEKLGHLS